MDPLGYIILSVFLWMASQYAGQPDEPEPNSPAPARVEVEE